MAFKIKRGDESFENNIRALGNSSHLFNMSIWVEGYHAMDCDYIRIVADRFVGFSPKGKMGEHREDIGKVREIKFWTKTHFFPTHNQSGE